MSKRFYRVFIKRGFDVFFSLLLLVGLIPIIILISILVFFFIDKRFFFVQKRSGIVGKPFNLYKFRSLPAHISSFSGYENNFSFFLRKSGLDEIPQLYNILIGDMSFVGPRPLLMEYFTRYTQYQSQRLLVKPGLTGLAQIKGFNQLEWNHRFRYDVFYVKKQRFTLDSYIIFKTILIFVLLKRFQKAQPLYSEKFQ